MTDQQLTKLTVNLIPKAVVALDAAHHVTGHTKTDTINRALQLYAAIVASDEAGARWIDFGRPDGSRCRLWLRRWWWSR